MSFSMKKRGWSSSNWNWGYAQGEAHDLAISVRSSLQSPTSRERFIAKCVNNQIDIEEIKMVLALRFQMAARQGKDGNGIGWNIMNQMADCKYESENGITLLCTDLNELINKLPSELTNTIKIDDTINIGPVVAKSLVGTDFIKDGL